MPAKKRVSAAALECHEKIHTPILDFSYFYGILSYGQCEMFPCPQKGEEDMIQLIATDMDGTLLDEKKQLPPQLPALLE